MPELRLMEIPEGSVEIQTGLWLYTYTYTFNGNNNIGRKLYSSEGYCFYDSTAEVTRHDPATGEWYVVPEEDILPSERIYMQYAAIPIIKDVNDFVSVPVDPSYEIVSASGKVETA